MRGGGGGNFAYSVESRGPSVKDRENREGKRENPLYWKSLTIGGPTGGPAVNRGGKKRGVGESFSTKHDKKRTNNEEKMRSSKRGKKKDRRSRRPESPVRIVKINKSRGGGGRGWGLVLDRSGEKKSKASDQLDIKRRTCIPESGGVITNREKKEGSEVPGTKHAAGVQKKPKAVKVAPLEEHLTIRGAALTPERKQR